MAIGSLLTMGAQKPRDDVNDPSQNHAMREREDRLLFRR